LLSTATICTARNRSTFFEILDHRIDFLIVLADHTAGTFARHEIVFFVGVVRRIGVRTMVSDEDQLVIAVVDRFLIDVLLGGIGIIRDAGEFLPSFGYRFARLGLPAGFILGGFCRYFLGGFLGGGKFLAGLASGFSLPPYLFDSLVETLDLLIREGSISTFGEIREFEWTDGDAFEGDDFMAKPG
jgi:hypothetical protein